MPKHLSYLQKEIMCNTDKVKDWEKLDKEVSEAMLYATEEEIQTFVDSGAGEALDMACSAIREIRKNN